VDRRSGNPARGVVAFARRGDEASLGLEPLDRARLPVGEHIRHEVVFRSEQL